MNAPILNSLGDTKMAHLDDTKQRSQKAEVTPKILSNESCDHPCKDKDDVLAKGSLSTIQEGTSSPMLMVALEAFMRDLPGMLKEGKEGQWVAYKGEQQLTFAANKSVLVSSHLEDIRNKRVLVRCITARALSPVPLSRY